MGRPATQYTTLWSASNELPVDCFFCSEPVFSFGSRGAKNGVIHHIDGDHNNDDPTNWAVVHRGCHSKHHADEAWKRGRRNTLPLGRKPGFHHSEETKQKIRASNRKAHIVTDAGRQRMVEAKTSKSPCPGCGRELNPTWMKRHDCQGSK